jgi:murein DD-endopeptidase MepM/ murein hydrolase activator NlpD
MMRFLAVFLVLGLGAATGCTRIDELTSEQPAQLGQPSRGYKVASVPGETLDDMAHRFGVSTEALIQANHLQPPYTLRPHQVLVVPPPPTYTVRSGDTVAGIATMLGADEGEIARANGLQKPYQMKVGQVLKIPGGVAGTEGAESVAGPSVVTSVPRPSISASPLAPPPGVSIGPGSAPTPTVLPPAAALAESAAAAAALPTHPTAAPVQTPRPATSSPTALAPQQPAQQMAAAPIIAAPPAPPPAAAPSPEASPAPTAAPGPASGKAGAGAPHFLTPVKGDIVGRFGSDGSGQKNDGINIAAPAGTPVEAADAGTVIYAGNELPAFGNLVMIRHAGGWVTAYGHLGSIAVQRGASVARGQPLGTVGQTGSVSTPQLHFEIRQGSSPVDPAPYLAGGKT